MKVNDRVRLKPFEDQPEQFGYIVDEDGDLWLVYLDAHCFTGLGDDGLRSVPAEQLEVIDEDQADA